MGLFKKLSKALFGEVDTSGAINAANQGNARARQLLNPGIAANESALARVSELLSNPGSFEGSPAFDFALNQGVAARDKSAAARGQLGSGAQQKELTAFGTGLANQERGNEIMRFLQFIGQTNPNVRLAAVNEGQLGKDLAGIHLGKENADMAGASSLFSGVSGLLGAGLGRF